MFDSRSAPGREPARLARRRKGWCLGSNFIAGSATDACHRPGAACFVAGLEPRLWSDAARIAAWPRR